MIVTSGALDEPCRSRALSHDFLRIETLQGDDTVDTSGLEPGQVTLRII